MEASINNFSNLCLFQEFNYLQLDWRVALRTAATSAIVRQQHAAELLTVAT